MSDYELTSEWIQDNLRIETDKDAATGEVYIYIACEYCDIRFISFLPGMPRSHDYVRVAVTHYACKHPAKLL